MTQDNIFKEIEEDIERQKLEDWWKKYGPVLVAVALAIVLATAIYNFWQGHAAEQRQKATGQLAAIAGEKDTTKQIEALESFARNNAGQTQATLAALNAAALAAKDDKKTDAIHIYDAVASDTKADHIFRQLADLLSVQMQLDSGDPAQLQTRLQPLLESKQPWRFTAMEYSGYLALRAGDKAKAKELLTNLSQDAGAPQTLTTRAAEILRSIAE